MIRLDRESREDLVLILIVIMALAILGMVMATIAGQNLLVAVYQAAIIGSACLGGYINQDYSEFVWHGGRPTNLP